MDRGELSLSQPIVVRALLVYNLRMRILPV